MCKKSVDRMMRKNVSLRTAENLYHKGLISREVMAAFRIRLKSQLILQAMSSKLDDDWESNPDQITAVG